MLFFFFLNWTLAFSCGAYWGQNYNTDCKVAFMTQQHAIVTHAGYNESKYSFACFVFQSCSKSINTWRTEVVFWRYCDKMLPCADHIYDRRICLLAEEFQFILLANLSAAEYLIYFRVSIQLLFISKTFQYFMCLYRKHFVAVIASGSVCYRNLTGLPSNSLKPSYSYIIH